MIGFLSRGVVTCLILTVGYGGLGAQSLPFRHYTPDSDIAPLPSAEVQKVYQDARGFIWFAVYSSGVARYDGERLERFTEADGLRDLNVWEVVEDASGRLWISSDAGLVVSERPLQDYAVGERPTFTDSLGQIALSSQSVRQNLLVADSTGIVWAAPADLGIIRYDVSDKMATKTDTFQLDEPHLFQSIELGAAGTLLVTGVTESGGYLWRVDPSRGSFDEFASFSDDTPSASLVTADAIFIGTRSGVLWRGTESDQGLQLKWIADGIDGVIVGILARSKNDLWLATEGAGLIRVFVDDEGRGQGYTTVRGSLGQYAHQLMLDREGNLWVAQSGGASRLPHNFDAYDSYSAEPSSATLASDLVTSVAPPTDRSCLWAGTIGGGITCINAVGRSHTLNAELPTNRVNAMTRGSDGTLWLGTASGVLALAPAQTRFRDVTSTFPVSLPGWAIRSGASSIPFRVHDFGGLDASIEAAGRFNIKAGSDDDVSVEAIWFAASESVMLFINRAWIILSEGNGLPSTIMRAVEIDDQGQLWIGTLDQGLYRSVGSLTAADLAPKRGSRTVDVQFEQVWTVEHGAPTNEIESMLYYDGVLWVGTAAGLAALDPVSAMHGAVITEGDGLPAANATSVDVSPITNTIWVGTNAGLAEVDPTERTVLRTITKADGLIDNEVC
ncbi:MAG: two-component regulator propeller domain-containing protein, partial [Rhodothermia bacterium]